MIPRTDPEMNTDSIHTMQISTCPASTKSVVTKAGFFTFFLKYTFRYSAYSSVKPGGDAR